MLGFRLLLLFLLAGGGAGDRDALLAVKKDWGSPPALQSWDPAAAPDHCNWAGVTCAAAAAGGGGCGVVTGLALSRLNLTGLVPASVCALKSLARLDLSYNNLTGPFPAAALYPCAELRFLDLSNNQLSGPLLRDIDGLSPAMEHLNLSTNGFAGEVPPAVARLPSLKSLILDTNRFSGEFPARIWSFPKLTTVMIQNNSFTGTLPSEISPSISRLEMGNNMFSGSFPKLALGLKVFRAENNRLAGELPADMSKLGNLTDLSVAGNRIAGSIPASIKFLQRLNTLDLSGNRISGVIQPGSLGTLPALTTLDFFLGNPGLCARAGSGTNLPTCRGARAKLSKGLIILSAAVLAGIVLICSTGIAWLLLFRRQKERQQAVKHWKMTAFTHINFTESDVLSNIRPDNVIGSGGSGEVYRIRLGHRVGVMGSIAVAIERLWNTRKQSSNGYGAGSIVAVKKICRSSRPRMEKEFNAEVNVLGSVRHANIVQLLCCISNEEEKLIVLEYMKNGSLDLWLHHRDREGAPGPLDWPRRLAIAVDVARGLSYMHHDCARPVVHRDIKSKNILLDHNLHAKIADFGLTLLLPEHGLPVSVSTGGGTQGYMAPETLYSNKVSEKVDVYSFGILLLELITAKAPDENKTGMGLAQWARRERRRCQEEGIPFDNIVDEAVRVPAYMPSIISVFELGVRRTTLKPRKRPSMGHVLHDLIACQQNI
ncbi:unnamed protein product [Urochloa decumbens]|uniref:Protein kinase domain-containing protein n=1 Tax=Urochloa decumbens TaxID=240449 RepID=A0ABC9E2B8_9POAL